MFFTSLTSHCRFPLLLAFDIPKKWAFFGPPFFIKILQWSSNMDGREWPGPHPSVSSVDPFKGGPLVRKRYDDNFLIRRFLHTHRIPLFIGYQGPGYIEACVAIRRQSKYVSCLLSVLFPSFFPVSRWEAWNLFQMTFDGATRFNVIKALSRKSKI